MPLCTRLTGTHLPPPEQSPLLATPRCRFSAFLPPLHSEEQSVPEGEYVVIHLTHALQRESPSFRFSD